MQAGGGPAATYLFCFAKKGKPKKATADLPPVMALAPSHFVHPKKWEMNETRCAQTTFISDPFSVTHKMLRPERMKVKNNYHCNTSAELNFRSRFLLAQLAYYASW
ncbi:MAG: hypothetical protein V4634_19345 [Pseudomonadota bacterium]